MSEQAGGALTVVPSIDVACFRLRQADPGLALEALLVRRARDPFAGRWALPGGVVRRDERLADAAHRVLRERTGLDIAHLEQLYTFDDPDRDPRGRTLAVAHLALLPIGESAATAGRDVEELAWRPADDPAAEEALAFDHALILRYARQRLRGKVEWTPLVFQLLPATFTLPDARRVYEAIHGEHYNDSNFRRQLLARFPGLEPVADKDRRSNRPAQLFRYVGPRAVAGPPESAPVAAG
jgi:8-oxo-dGTP diphosphatase